MKTIWLSFMALLLAVVNGPAQSNSPPVVGFNFTNLWRFDQSGTNNGSAWRSPAFDDSAWPEGGGFFGVYTNSPYPYPEPIQTPLTLGGGRLTYYFRTHFNFPSNTVGMALVASNFVDDGAVFYLNGSEAGRIRMNAGAVDYQTSATSSAPGGPVQTLTLPTGSLVPGDNVLAVEVHQTSATNSDLVFGMNLTGMYLPGLAHKLLVDSSDTVTISQLATNGATNLASYPAFSLWSATANQAPASLLSAPSVTIRYDFDAISLRGGLQISSQTGPPAIPPNLAQVRTNGSQLWMVQYAGPIQNSWLTELTNTGVQVIWYAPANAYVVWGSLPALTNLDSIATNRSYILGDYPYHPYYRLEPSLQRLAASQPSNQIVNVTVQIVNSPQLSLTLSSLQALGGVPRLNAAKIQTLTSISLPLPAGQLVAIANWRDVYNIEPWGPPIRLDEVQDQIVAGNITTVSGKIVPLPTSAPTYTPYRLWLISKGFSLQPASYPIVDVVDDGIDQGQVNNVLNPDFFVFGNSANSVRLAYIASASAVDLLGNGIHGHGNLNAGIVGGYNNSSGPPYVDSNGFNRGIGVSPFGRIAGTKIFADQPVSLTYPEGEAFDLSAVGNLQGLVSLSYGNGANMTSDSWGYYPVDINGHPLPSYSEYDSESQAYDALTRDASGSATPALHEMLHVFSAGNTGPGVSTGGSPGTAKNVLTVGATQNVRDNGTLDGSCVSSANNADSVIFFSSRGPCSDGRSKPDIMAPGTHIQGPASFDPAYDGLSVSGAETGNCNTTFANAPYYPTGGQTLYTWSSGTSHSCPAVAGGASLAYEFYQTVLNPGHPPSPAMLKALLINSTRYLALGNDTLPSKNQGWGDMNLGLAFDGIPRVLVDQTTIFTTSGGAPYTANSLTVFDATKPVRVTLVWSDAPGNTTGNSWVNDLNLEVTAGGTIYKGNVFSGQNSVSGGTADTKNNVENVFLPAGTAGPISVKIIPANIAGPGIPDPNNLNKQDFALVIYNAVQPVGPAADVFIRDFAADVGTEPNTAQLDYWESPDVWNRLDSAPDATQTHQDPQYGVDNWVNVYLHNTGTPHLPTPHAATGVVKLYWAYGDSLSVWPTSWNWFADVPVTIPAGQTKVVNALWRPAGLGHFCLTAIWVSGQDPLHAALTSDYNGNTINNNNIAWRNMQVGAAPPNQPKTYSFIMRNPSTNTNSYNMRVRARPALTGGTFLDAGQIFFDLGPTLFPRWFDAGAQGGGFQIVSNQFGTVLQVLDPTNTFISGIPMDPGEEQSVSISFLAHTNTVQTFTVDAAQMLDTNTPLGGMTYLMSTGPTLDSVGDGIPDWWRALYFGDGATTNNSSCATCDPDHDGFDNLQEFLAGTDPTNSSSRFLIDQTTIQSGVPALRLQFYANSNRTYSVLYRSELATGAWQLLTNISALPTGQQISVFDPAITNGVPKRFYRLVTPGAQEY